MCHGQTPSPNQLCFISYDTSIRKIYENIYFTPMDLNLLGISHLPRDLYESHLIYQSAFKVDMQKLLIAFWYRSQWRCMDKESDKERNLMVELWLAACMSRPRNEKYSIRKT